MDDANIQADEHINDDDLTAVQRFSYHGARAIVLALLSTVLLPVFVGLTPIVFITVPLTVLLASLIYMGIVSQYIRFDNPISFDRTVVTWIVASVLGILITTDLVYILNLGGYSELARVILLGILSVVLLGGFLGGSGYVLWPLLSIIPKLVWTTLGLGGIGAVGGTTVILFCTRFVQDGFSTAATMTTITAWIAILAVLFCLTAIICNLMDPRRCGAVTIGFTLAIAAGIWFVLA